jgi:hypothetical protein
MDAHEIDRARAALWAIPADLARDDWVRVGMAAHAAGLSFDTFDQWSAQAGNYDARAARDTWRSFKHGKGIGPGTLFSMAADHGYRAAKTPQEPRKAKTPTNPKGNPAAPVWSRCKPVTGHSYIEAKQGIAEGLRVVPDGDPLTIAGHSVAGWLAVPAYGPGGDLQSLQFIPPPGQGKKLNMPGASMAGASFTVGTLAPGGLVYVVEGIGQAWACWKATGHPAIVAFGWGNVARVAATLRQRDNAARLVIVPDRGKEAAAEKIARDLGAAVAFMPQDEPDNFDANDYGQREGFDALEHLLSQATEPPKPAPRYKLLTAADLEAMPPLQWRIKGVMPTRGLAQIYGPSKAGKSFLSFDMACAIAEGRRWFGYRVNAAPVVYVALEGEAGFKLRAEAWKRHNCRALPADLHLVMQPFRINHAQDVQDLAAVVPSGAVIVIDTQNRAAPNADENAARDMGEIIEGAKTLQALADGLVILVAHTGKDASKGPRGHSSQIPAVDAAIEVSRNGDRRAWRADKVKDGADGAEHGFRLEVIELGTDDDGDTLTSCAIAPDDHAPRHKLMTEAQRQGIAAYCLACEAGNGTLDAAGNFIGLHLEAWRDSFYRISTADTQDAKKKAFQRIRKDLAAAGLVTVADDVYRVTEPGTSIREGQFANAARYRDTGQRRDIAGTSPDHQAGQAGHVSLDMSRCPDGEPY